MSVMRWLPTSCARSSGVSLNSVANASMTERGSMVGPVAEDSQHREHEGLVVRDRHATAYYLTDRVVERWDEHGLEPIDAQESRNSLQLAF